MSEELQEEINPKVKEEPKKTVGQLLADTQDEHLQENVEVGEFVDEVGNKEVMKEVWRQIDERRTLPQWNHKFYLLVLFKKDTILHRAIRVYVQARHTPPQMEPSLTCFSYDPKKDVLLLEWVLPQKHAFKTFLSTRDYNDPFLMKCIDDYLKENPILKKIIMK